MKETSCLKALPNESRIPFRNAFRLQTKRDHFRILDIFSIEEPRKRERQNFEMKNSGPGFSYRGKTVAFLDPYGNFIIQGKIFQRSKSFPSNESLVFSNKEGIPKFWLEPISGDLHIKGILYEKETQFGPQQLQGSFVFKKENAPSFYITPNGTFHLKGLVITRKEKEGHKAKRHTKRELVLSEIKTGAVLAEVI